MSEWWQQPNALFAAAVAVTAALLVGANLTLVLRWYLFRVRVGSLLPIPAGIVGAIAYLVTRLPHASIVAGLFLVLDPFDISLVLLAIHLARERRKR